MYATDAMATAAATAADASQSSSAAASGMTTRDFFAGARFGWIILFGIVGILLRYLLNVLFIRGFKTDAYWSTLIINVVGSAVIGVLQVVGVEQKNIDMDLRYGLMVGLLGGFTTFSGYCLDSVLLFDKHVTKDTIIGVFYFIMSPGIGLAVTYGAVLLTRRHYQPATDQQGIELHTN
ncbi:hypothetical protein SAMD00019534_033620 [Acytostelium subglobosum LB1]|uniref:hypothetical protein n=1 Tax=Acytostelium subglobosum LB1 TaxID=1410327 RepID=UPI000644CDBD|nr:hypothetical protein SAMD00019534_033620 [Acytostelium subglobosum LB1]GAM20187.1 hypothetical protein SAMD00019534_033620 [Acytostelium subglobosum LB1]|eukprot:XP_012759708.1 hypothetical protein SAMD00019534_033620 [Acytostelium subglobosum LB1]